ncbi:MAG: N-acetylmuramoyl-L-alanine amidase [Lachnospiraceae bacterium]
MEKKILKGVAVFLLFFSLAGNGILQFLPEIQGAVKEKQMEDAQYEKQRSGVIHTKTEPLVQQIKKIPYLIKRAESEKEETFDKNSQLKFSLPQGVKAQDIKIETEPLAAVIKVTVPKAGSYYFDDTPVQGRNEHMIEASYQIQNKNAVITMKFDQVMEIKTSSNPYFFYLSFLTPKERYDKVVVIDPGHGGTSVGESVGNVQEKDINLAIAKKLESLLEEQHVGVYCTRNEDVNPTDEARAALAKSAQADYFISIHCNRMKNEKFYYITGTEVVCQQSKKFEKASQFLAESCLLNLTKQCSMVNRGMKREKENSLLKQVEVPSVMVRVGFLSNAQEKKKLMSDAYQKKIAQALCDALLQNEKSK